MFAAISDRSAAPRQLEFSNSAFSATKWVSGTSKNQRAFSFGEYSTIIHELGHTLGIGWEDWRKLFDDSTGKFKNAAVRKLAELEDMEVEREFDDFDRTQTGGSFVAEPNEPHTFFTMG